MEPCEVIKFHPLEAKFEVKWVHTGKHKLCTRLNLLFDNELEPKFWERVHDASRLVQDRALRILGEAFVDVMDDGALLAGQLDMLLVAAVVLVQFIVEAQRRGSPHAGGAVVGAGDEAVAVEGREGADPVRVAPEDA